MGRGGDTVIGTVRFVVVAVLMAAVAGVIHLRTNITVPINKPFAFFPSSHAGWRMVYDGVFSEGVLAVLKPTDYLSRRYVDERGNAVGLYVGYHSGGEGSGGIHSPRHCLPGSGWMVVESGKTTVPLEGGARLELVRSVYQKGEEKELFMYWFQVRDRALTDEYSLKLAEITGSVFQRRRDTSFIRISVPYTTEAVQASSRAERFIRDFYPLIREHLPR